MFFLFNMQSIVWEIFQQTNATLISTYSMKETRNFMKILT